MNTSSQTLQSQGSPIVLLAHLRLTLPGLPAAEFHLSPVYPGRLDVSTHGPVADFGVWMKALGLPAPEPVHYNGSSWLATEGVVDDVPVVLNGYGSLEDVQTFATTAVAA